MDVLLINPPWYKRKGNIWRGINPILPPLGLAYIGSFLEREGVKVEILDAQAEGCSVSKIYNKLKTMKGVPNFIGITATTSTIGNALDVAQICKTIYPKSKVILGGVHPTALPDEVMKDENIDYVVRGEGEATFWEIVNGKKEEEILGLSYKSKGSVFHNIDRPVFKCLDDLPFPAYHLLPIEKYRPAIGAYKRLPAMSMLTTRGCPGHCTFCFGNFLGERTRYRSARNIVNEIKLLQSGYGIKEISFYDDVFTTFKSNIQDLCRLIIEENIDITWSCFSRVDFVDEATLRLMKKAGCHQICYGIESGNEQILRNIKKETSLDKAKEIIALTKSIGIETRTSFMFGNPGETEETMRETINFAVSLEPDIAIFNITTPYPGTEMFLWAKEKGYLKTTDWSKYDLSQSILELPTVNSKIVEYYYHTAYKKFYRRVNYLLKRLCRTQSVNDLKMDFQAAWTMFLQF
ncbi:MAG: radical SAM protein [bacterium]|nr:radical SAM protein [bacterium]